MSSQKVRAQPTEKSARNVQEKPFRKGLPEESIQFVETEPHAQSQQDKRGHLGRKRYR